MKFQFQCNFTLGGYHCTPTDATVPATTQQPPPPVSCHPGTKQGGKHESFFQSSLLHLLWWLGILFEDHPRATRLSARSGALGVVKNDQQEKGAARNAPNQPSRLDCQLRQPLDQFHDRHERGCQRHLACAEWRRRIRTKRCFLTSRTADSAGLEVGARVG